VPDENWRPVVGWEGLYEVSDLGRVRTIPRPLLMRNGLTRMWGVRYFSLAVPSRGYKAAKLADGRRKATIAVHRLVLEAFVGPCPEGMECCHGPGGRHDNRLSNLRWATHAENIADKKAHGTQTRGERSPAAKLTEAQAVEALDRCARGERPSTVAKHLGVSRACVELIVIGRNWRHLPRAATHTVVL
jgi:ribosomal protein S14